MLNPPGQWVRVVRIALLGMLLLASPTFAQEGGNLLRNADFQDDWATLIPQSKTLHWSYPYDYQNRRDYNPDGWTLRGSWEWQNEDAPAGARRLVLHGPDAEVRQRVNWVAVHDERKVEGFPDAGGFPTLAVVRSQRPLRVVGDVLLRVRLRGARVPAGAGSITVALDPPGKPDPAEPLGSLTESIVATEVSLPAGTFGWKWVEARLAAEDWQRAAQAHADRDPGEEAELRKTGLALPASARVTIRYRGKTGMIEIGRAELSDVSAKGPNLLVNGSFEERVNGELPKGWEGPEKYTAFPPGRYYLFNTWHNEGFANRGRPAVESLVVHGGRASLRMPVLAGDEIAVRSAPVALHQKSPRLIEVTAWVKTDRVNQIQIDAVDGKGERLDGFDFVNKALISIGTDDWRLVRQIFRPRSAVDSVRILLCARGVNGYTLGNTAGEPQNNVAGTVWWDDVLVSEPETSDEELRDRGVSPALEHPDSPGVHLALLDLGERLFGENVLRATVVNPAVAADFAVELDVVSPSGSKRHFATATRHVAAGSASSFRLRYILEEPSPAYAEYRCELRIRKKAGEVVASTEVAFATWTAPIALELGALYLRPEQTTQLVRLNLGLSAATMARAATVRLEIVRRRDRKVVQTREIAADAAATRSRRERIPTGLRGDFSNLLLADLDVSHLPVEAFDAPERRWIVRAEILDRRRAVITSASSAAFCRQAHQAPQPPVQSVSVQGNVLRVNGAPWIPWGGIYGFTPSYQGPADPPSAAARDLHNLPGWSYYSGYTPDPYNRRDNDLNTVRYFPGYDGAAISTSMASAEEKWKSDDLYAATFFVAPSPGVLSLADLEGKVGGAAKLDEILRFAASAPMVVSVGPGFEEIFGRFHAATPENLASLKEVVDRLRSRTGKPVMVGHGGAWNRFEFEKVPFFDIYDPETEPLYPANLHTDLRPLVDGKNKVIWLRPQVYESVPYERWRVHVFVELMRGARGWQFAHGPADASTLRGLHGELESLLPLVDSQDAGPAVELEPSIEHWSRRVEGKTVVIAATTHALTLGAWRWSDAQQPPGARRSRISEAALGRPGENPLDRIVDAAEARWVPHAIDSFPEPRRWPAGTRLRQWVRLDPDAPASSLALLLKIDGRWQSAAAWGAIDLARLRADPSFGYWFLRHFHRNAVGFIGYDGKGLTSSLAYLPARLAAMGAAPKPGEWVKLEVPIERFEAADRPIEGVGFLHEDGRVSWGHTSFVDRDGKESMIWGDDIGLAPAELANVRVRVGGLEKGARIRVLFEDRELVAGDGVFVDDFRGEDLYQRYGGVDGYGRAPVALHVYEVPAPTVR